MCYRNLLFHEIESQLQVDDEQEAYDIKTQDFESISQFPVNPSHNMSPAAIVSPTPSLLNPEEDEKRETMGGTEFSDDEKPGPKLQDAIRRLTRLTIRYPNDELEMEMNHPTEKYHSPMLPNQGHRGQRETC